MILHTTLKKREIVDTLAGCLFGMSLFKIAGHVAVGFDYSPFAVIIGAGIAASFAGTWVGWGPVDAITETMFRAAYRLLVTASTARRLYVSVVN